jgi:hypothetical protein
MRRSSPCYFAPASCLLSALIAGGAGCDARVVEAVEPIPFADAAPANEAGVQGDSGSGGGSSDGSTPRDVAFDTVGGLDTGGAFDTGGPSDTGGSFDAGGSVDAACLPDAPTGLTVWPNCVSAANSDPWLVRNHDSLTAIRPRLLVLHFWNAWTVTQADQGARAQIRALREGSRYHAYAQPNAPPFLDYEIAKIVDLTDHPPPPTWTNPSSTLLPVTAAGDFDTGALFSPAFADNIKIMDPGLSRNLTLCELFDRGLVNEVWVLEGEGGRRRPPLTLERKQAYDAAGAPIAGQFVCVEGSGCVPEINCLHTVRLAHLDPTRGEGCDMEVRGWNLEHLRSAVPYLETNLRAFFNADFRTRFSAPFDSFNEICDRKTPATPCVSYPSPSVAAGTLPSGTSWRISPFVQGCGTPEFPPNATARYDWQGRVQAQSRCEHYGMRDGDGGQDVPDLYNADKVAAYDNAFGRYDCGTGWQVYWRQSLPGFGNRAIDVDGKPMKNFWPFLFY